ncbi:MAG: response regulator transcription factor, partial [Clostridiales bacterium]|nr:response regulator transcription factor [Clostridiales bacterium]
MGRKVLVVDDEKNIVDVIVFNLKKEGYDPIVAYDGKEGLNLALAQKPEIVLLDIMMPQMDGFEVCRKIREKSQVPIIMLTARAEELDKVLGLELGADDYVTKPFSVRELMARVKVNIRRMESVTGQGTGSNLLYYGSISIDPDRYEVRRNGTLIDLTRREFDLIKFLATQNTMVFSREALLEKVWG